MAKLKKALVGLTMTFALIIPQEINSRTLFESQTLLGKECIGMEPKSLVNGERFVDLLIEHEVGIKKTGVEILSIDHDFLDNVESDTYAWRKG